MRHHRLPARLRAPVLVALLSATLACGSLITPLTPTPTLSPGSLFQLVTPTPPPTATATVAPPPLPTPLPTATPLPTPTPETPWLQGEVRAYPGPLHYEGDILSLEVPIHNIDDLPNGRTPLVAIDDGEPFEAVAFPVYSPLRVSVLAFPDVWDTTGQQGLHKLTLFIPLTDEGESEELITYIEVLPADQRPLQEQEARWEQRALPCCDLYYLSGTAAGRDIGQIAGVVAENVAAVNAHPGLRNPQRIPIMLIDTIWGNGAYAGDALVISYVDRPYHGLDLGTVIRHEATHWATRSPSTGAPTLLVEGIAVYVAGGHYRPEPIPERAAALLALDAYVPLTDLANDFRRYQHEAAYLEAGGLTAYLVERYGWSRYLAFYRTPGLRSSGAEWLDQAMRRHFQTGLEEIERDFIAWLEEQPSEDQVDSVRLTIALHETIRRYQALYAPYQERLPGLDQALEENRTAEFIREPTAPENIALETLLISAHQAHQEGRYTTCEALLEAINATLDDGDFTRPPISDYMAIVTLLAGQGYEVQRIEIAGQRATVAAIREWPQVENLSLSWSDGGWRLDE